ncbi:MAG: flagellin [Deltaproteobacteria bacterium]|jgi:flagellin|nr:flagellin [Deltaproteobacteria bacterium]
MGLVLNHNMPAIFASNMLGRNYARLAVNTARLSSGLKINGPADDPAGYGVREMMRTELDVNGQGIRNVADMLSLMHTAEGAMAVIDEKLVRMKELAEQAATGTYTTLQRDIINSEYQMMAAEIDRIANATEFNGVKLLNGSINPLHRGQGLKVHFGMRDSIAEDYYFIQICDLRATASTGLAIAGDEKNDIWATTALEGFGKADGCCGGGIPSLNGPVEEWASGQIFSYGYNWDLGEDDDTLLSRGRYVAGAYQIQSGTSLERLIDSVNRGTQSRVRIDFRDDDTVDTLVDHQPNSSANRICLGDEIYYVGSYSMNLEACEDPGEFKFYSMSSSQYSLVYSAAQCFAMTVNENSDTYWAKLEDHVYRPGYRSVYVFNREGGDHDGDVFGTDQRLGAIADRAGLSSSILWYNDETEESGTDGSWFGNGGEAWGVLKAQPTGLGTWSVRLDGRDTGDQRDLWILNAGSNPSAAAYDLNFFGYGGAKFGTFGSGSVFLDHAGFISGLNRETFTEIQNASGGDWAGAAIRTQSNAQEALGALDRAIAKKEFCRARLGAYITRLENTLTNREIMHDTTQAAESRISDVDIATEMTDFVRNQVLSQAAVSVLSQANSLPEMAMSLLNG